LAGSDFVATASTFLYSPHPRVCYLLRNVTARVQVEELRGQARGKSSPGGRYFFSARIVVWPGLAHLFNHRFPFMTHSIQISEILAHKGNVAWSVSPEATVLEAIRIMADKNVGALLVIQGEQLLGVISERDYTRKVALKGRSSRETPVRDIISGKVISVGPDQTVEDCMLLMTEHRIRHLPVVAGPRILGVISIGDLVNSIISHQTSAIHQLETYITGFPSPPA